MKTETYKAKLAALLGLTEVHEATKEAEANRNRPIPISETQIQSFRAAQGLSYFLQAPKLFTAKTCKHCGENFLVSRKYVQFCSYTCIQKDLEERGIRWTKGEDFEALANDPQVYDGNEPIWIRNLPQVQTALEYLLESQSSLTTTSPQGQST